MACQPCLDRRSRYARSAPLEVVIIGLYVAAFAAFGAPVTGAVLVVLYYAIATAVTHVLPRFGFPIPPDAGSPLVRLLVFRCRHPEAEQAPEPAAP